MARKNDVKIEETNKTFQKVISLLKEKNIAITYPIIVNTSNIEDFAWITCNYLGTGIHIPLNEIDFNDFRGTDPEIFRHCSTWSYIDKNN